MRSENFNLSAFVERWGPFIMALFVFSALIIFRDKLLPLFIPDDGWELENLYAAVFNWSSIQTGFIFGIYGYVVGKTDGFVSEIKRTVAMRQFLSYTKKAIFIGFALTFISIPLVVIHNSINLENHVHFSLLSAWFSLFVWGFLSFLRVAYMFGLITRVSDKEKIQG